MNRSHLWGRLVATTLLVGVLIGATRLFAAGAMLGDPGPKLHTAARGALSISDSESGAAIFTTSNLAPGHSTEGTVTVANTGAVAGSLALSDSELSGSAGTYGGALSEVLELQVREVGSDTEIYSGRLDSMPERQLGALAPGESHAYRFVVTLPDTGSPTADWNGENIYQHAAVSITYDWTLTEAPSEGEPESTPTTPPLAPVQSPQPHVEGEEAHPEQRLVGTSGADVLIGTARDDLIYGIGGADRISGKAGDDYLWGGRGADSLYGAAGSDRLRGGPGADQIHGGPGSDVLFARDGEPDLIDCGSGHDLAYVDQNDRTSNCEAVSYLYGRVLGSRASAP
jgi:RTX calcium-binding nonapeptide repeat (4 copies)